MLTSSDAQVGTLPPGDLKLWLRWVLAHILILGFVTVLGLWAIGATYYGLGGLAVLPLAIVAPFLAQWIGIRGVGGPAREARVWLLATLIGMLLGAAIVALLVLASVSAIPWLASVLWPISFAIFGGTLGLLQSLVLQRRVSRAFWWIPANALAFLAGSVIATLAEQWVVAAVAGISIFSIVTGTTLVWLVAHTSEVRPVFSWKQVAWASAILGTGAVLLAAISFFQFQESIHTNNTELYAVSMVSPAEGWVIGRENEGTAIFHYGGGKWTETYLPQPLKVETLRSISMASESEGWSVGDSSTFLHYSNGTWSKAEHPGISPDLYLHSVDMLSPSEGWAIGGAPHGGASTLLHYSVGKWASVPNPSSELLESLDFDSPDDGWAVSSEGTFLHYTNGAWQQFSGPEPITTRLYLRVVQMVSRDEGWAIGNTDRGYLMLHYDGRQWSRIESPADWALSSISMISPHEGWAVGYTEDRKTDVRSGLVAYYKGDKWVSEELPDIQSLRPLNSVSMISSDEGWAVGNGSTLLHYKSGTWTRYP